VEGSFLTIGSCKLFMFESSIFPKEDSRSIGVKIAWVFGLEFIVWVEVFGYPVSGVKADLFPCCGERKNEKIRPELPM
jgi:hypothetical protein